jgi:DNA-binding MarR family transcriptional regulator
MAASAFEDPILRALRRIVRAIDMHSRQLEQRFGLTGPQLVCLRVLVAQGPMTASELARAIDLSQATLTGIVDRLVRGRVATRKRDPRDRRRVSIAATARGVELVETAPSPLQTKFADRLTALPTENQAAIAEMLEQIVRMMDAEGIDAAPVLAAGALSEPSPEHTVGPSDASPPRDVSGRGR